MTSTDARIQSAIGPEHPLPPCVMSAVELTTYFPHHCGRYPELLITRFHNNGWNLAQIAKAQLFARDAYDEVTFRRRADALRQAIGVAGEVKFGVPRFAASDAQWAGHPGMQPFQDQGSAAANQALYNISLANPPVLPPPSVTPAATATLEEVANGVVVHPTGEDEGIFTKVIRWALHHGVAHQYTTDDVMHIANNPVNFYPPPDVPGQPLRRLNTLPPGADTHRWDQQCRDRVQGIDRPW